MDHRDMQLEASFQTQLLTQEGMFAFFVIVKQFIVDWAFAWSKLYASLTKCSWNSIFFKFTIDQKCYPAYLYFVVASSMHTCNLSSLTFWLSLSSLAFVDSRKWKFERNFSSTATNSHSIYFDNILNVYSIRWIILIIFIFPWIRYMLWRIRIVRVCILCA